MFLKQVEEFDILVAIGAVVGVVIGVYDAKYVVCGRAVENTVLKCENDATFGETFC